jgi:hypothetical protein
MIAAGLLAILSSAALLAVLGHRDPKRLRNQRLAFATPLPASTRRLLGWMVPMPGVALALLGEWWPFLVWLGALCVLGWIASQILAIRSGHSAAD